MKIRNRLLVTGLVILLVASLATLVFAKNYEVVYRDVFAHDNDGPWNPVPEGTQVEMECDWYAVDDGVTDEDGYYTVYFEDPIPFPQPQNPLKWTSTIDNIPGWMPDGPTTISTIETVMLHEHIWEGDLE